MHVYRPSTGSESAASEALHLNISTLHTVNCENSVVDPH